MKSKIILIAIFAIAILAACSKNDMMNDSFNVDTQEYERLLSADYSNTSYFHNMLSTSANDTSYNMMMFNSNDSLFSEHFYEFCIDMMQNSGMMGTTTGMMGNNSGMMGGAGGMMNGTTMGSMADMNVMMSYMDSIHNSTQTLVNPDYMRADSLMHNQMTQCKMMTTQTAGIEDIFGKMQMLRANHQTMHKQ